MIQFPTIFLLSLTAVLLFSCSPSAESENHIHSLAFDPTDEGTVYKATHYYIEKEKNGQQERIGFDNDYMGFVIAADGTFYSSGHSTSIPDVGIRKSADKGNSWEVIGYEGRDFHDMAISYADPQLIYAWSTPPEELFIVSKDRGKSWQEINSKPRGSIFALTADHQKASTLYAGTLFGLFTSDDYGENWRDVSSLRNIPIIALADDPKTSGVMYISTQKGILKTVDNGETWTEMNEGLPELEENVIIILAINPFNPQELYAVTEHNAVYRYDGTRWNLQEEGEA